ncbi:hypothetical protein NP233_g12605 [Leucocoprinus birnbaumii]|uniref:Uncharacterized protein n=1 Tax=Leucocoprinus birnbaumii TaxID=56174 RepID=A0AAD5VG21_9AGAR|nr:hypothetical protein NP233_g12605 [Leucocoprinus birnbaumii]
MPRYSHSYFREGRTAFNKVNEDAITAFLLRFAADPTSASCSHGNLTPRLCTAKKKNANMKNAGRWYAFCRPCGKWRWLSRRLDVSSLLGIEEFAALIATRESLRDQRPCVGSQFLPVHQSSRSTRLVHQSSQSNRPVLQSSRPAHPVHQSSDTNSNDDALMAAARLIEEMSISISTAVSSTAITTPIRSKTITLKFWIKDFVGAHSIDIPRTESGAFCLEAHKLLFGSVGIEQVDALEIFDKLTWSWHPVLWSKSIYPGTEDALFLRVQGVTCMSRLFTVHFDPILFSSSFLTNL